MQVVEDLEHLPSNPLERANDYAQHEDHDHGSGKIQEPKQRKNRRRPWYSRCVCGLCGRYGEMKGGCEQE